jgi:response regulator of citrate/malate metabolism
MFDDKMYLKTGFTGKDLQRSIKKYGIYDRKMAEAKKMEQAQQDKLLE